MADPVADIVVQLRRRPNLKTSTVFRKDLNERFERLTPDQAADLLERIFAADGSRIPIDFRVLSRHVRVELLLKRALRLGTQTREAFAARLLGRAGQPPDPKLQKGLRLAFPPGTEPLRDKFVKAMRSPVSGGSPVIALEFRGMNQRISPDNQAPAVAFMPDTLGLDPDPTSGNNWMEIRGTVSGHRPDATYRFGRTIEQASWCLVRNRWRCLEHKPAGTDDDNNDADEDPHPDNDHIYVIDGPGPPIPPNLDKAETDERRDTTEYVYMIDAIESVDVKVGSNPWKPAGQVQWFSVSWLEKVGGKWRRKDGRNTIAPGAIEGISVGATVGEPPQTF